MSDQPPWQHGADRCGLSTLLFGVSSTSPWTYGAIAMLLVPLLVGLGACHHRPAPVHEASVAGRSAIGHGQPANDGLRRGFPGVVVARTPNGGTSVRLLGAMVGGGPPLYVIDGAPAVTDPSRGFGWLKPEDILRITVVKDPAETAVYGPRGVNGVVLITTRQAAPQRE